MSTLQLPDETAQHPPRAQYLGRIFLFALAIRWGYALVLLAVMGQAGLMGPDSQGYLNNGSKLANAIIAGPVVGWDLLGSDPTMMPLFSWLVAIHVLLAGTFAPLSYVLMQGLLDAGCCLLIYRIAETIDPRLALPAAIAASVNPTQIVLTGYLYTDTPFVFLVALFLFASLRWLQAPAWRWIWMIGLSLGAAALIRVLIVPWTLVLLGFLLVAAIARHGYRARLLGYVVACGAVFSLVISPLVARNVMNYDAWALTSQSGSHLALWVAPMVREWSDGTPWAAGAKKNRDEAKRRFGLLDNPFEKSRRFGEIGREALAQSGLVAAIKAWTYGSIINMAAPGIMLSPPVLNLPRTGFYYVTGSTIIGKIFNFLSQSAASAYIWIALPALAGVAAIRFVQLVGLYALIRERRQLAALVLLVLWIGFVLFVNGPIVSPKYRLPIEPALAIFTAAGFCLIRDRYWLRRARLQAPAN